MNLPTPVELLYKPGVIGQILHQIPKAVLREAGSQDEPWPWLAEWVNRSPGKCLRIGNVELFWPRCFRKVFAAAASQQRALRELGEVAGGGRSIARDWKKRLDDAVKAGDNATAYKCVKKIAVSILQTDKDWFKSAPPAIQKIVRQVEREAYATDVRRLGRVKADKNLSKPKALKLKVDSGGDRMAVLMAKDWLAGEGGCPGFCFMSDKLLAKFLGRALPLPSLLNESGIYHVVATRQRTGLKKAPVLFSDLAEGERGKWQFLDRRKAKTRNWVKFKQ